MKYEIRTMPTLHGSQKFEFVLLDPNGLVVHRSYSRGPSLKLWQRELQAAYEIGLEHGAKRP